MRRALYPAPLEANRGEFRLNAPAQGWEATFIEAEFSDGYIATSPVFITPDDRYPIAAPAGDGLACETLPGRGLGRIIAMTINPAENKTEKR